MDVRRLQDASAIVAIKEPWERLAGTVPFRSWDWADAWWRHYGAPVRGTELFLLAVSDGGRIVGLAPWFVERSAWFGRVLRFLGSGEAYSDYLSLLSEAGREGAVGEAIGAWLAGAGRDQWDVAAFDGIADGELAVAALLRALVPAGCAIQKQLGDHCWRLDLPSDWADYLALRSGSHRGELKRLERRFLSGGKAVLHTADTPEEVEHGLHWLACLHQERRNHLGDAGSFSSARFSTFHAEVALRFARNARLRLQWLEVEGRPVAVLYDFVGGDVIYGYASGIDLHAGLRTPGKLLFLAAFQDAISKGFRAYDFLRGDEAYKAHWRATPYPTWNYRLVPNRWKSWLRQGTWDAFRTLKRAAQRTLT